MYTAQTNSVSLFSIVHLPEASEGAQLRWHAARELVAVEGSARKKAGDEHDLKTKTGRRESCCHGTLQGSILTTCAILR